MKIACLYNKRHLNLEDVFNGSSPSDYSHGVFELYQHGFDVVFIDIDLTNTRHPESKIMFILGEYISPILYHEKCPKNYFFKILDLSNQLNKYDLVISISRKVSVALAIIKSLGFLSSHIIGIQTGLVNVKDNLFQKIVISRTLRKIHSIVLGKSEYLSIIDSYSLNTENISFIPFGIDLNFWTSDVTMERGDYILSVGNDHYRDFDLLIDVSKLIDKQVVIVSKYKFKSPTPENVKIIGGSIGEPVLSYNQLKALYQRALCLVTPIKETLQPSGQSSTLQAMACGTPVIISNFKGLWCDKQICDNNTALLYETGNIDSCLEKINLLINDSSLRRFIGNNGKKVVENRASADLFKDGLVNIINKLQLI